MNQTISRVPSAQSLYRPSAQDPLSLAAMFGFGTVVLSEISLLVILAS